MTELQWLGATCLMTGLFWLVYVLDRMIVIGPVRAMGNPREDDAPLAPWAQRARAAHANAVENLVVFAPLVLAAQALGLAGATMLMIAKVYFFARLAHFGLYTAGVPVVRTLAFAAGWIATVAAALVVLGFLV